jgi:hypothetical protein
MIVRVAIALATTVALTASAIVYADFWLEPQPLVFASAHGYYGFKTQPPRPFVPTGRAQGTLFNGSEEVVWGSELVNTPVRALVTDDGKHVVTLDTWTRQGYEHSLVIYGERGDVIADYNLEAFLSADEIAKSVVHTVGSRHWLQGGSIVFDEDWRFLVIRFHWGKVIRVTLATGAIDVVR